jgi:hypothetical protein
MAIKNFFEKLVYLYKTINELENLIIKKSCKIGHLQNRIEEQSLTISNLKNLLENMVYEKFQITSSDEIVKKIDAIYEKNLKRHIDAEGLLAFYPRIKNKSMNYTEFEELIQESIEFKLLQKKSQKNSEIKFGF